MIDKFSQNHSQSESRAGISEKAGAQPFSKIDGTTKDSQTSQSGSKTFDSNYVLPSSGSGTSFLEKIKEIEKGIEEWEEKYGDQELPRAEFDKSNYSMADMEIWELQAKLQAFKESKALFQGMIDETKEDIRNSKTYQKVLEHRKNCPKWGKEFCIECFGMGLTKCREGFLEEIKQEMGR